jgi:hypothetical protein
VSKTKIADIRNNAFPPLTIEEGTFVVWRNLDPHPHTVEARPGSSFYFNAGPLFTGGISSPVYFDRAGAFEYVCRYHAGMTGSVSVVAAEAAGDRAPAGHDHGGHGDHLQHFHGFVTGGRSGRRLFMTHTPVIADPRHHFQVILQGSLVEDAHVAAYDAVRQSEFANGKVQVFHGHISLAAIGKGEVTLLPNASLQYHPTSPDIGQPFPGLEEDIPVRIDRVLHFHQFDPDTEYPDGLAYVVYGDQDDVFIDHLITRAPSFHSVAKLAGVPDFWKDLPEGTTTTIRVPSKRIFDVSPKFLPRVAYVDNAFHLVWLPPPGAFAFGRDQPQDPLIRRDMTPPAYEVTLEDGKTGHIEIGRFLHFDIRLLNNRVNID